MLNAYEHADKHNWTKAELEAYDYVLMREEDERGRWALATRRAVEEAVSETEKQVKESIAVNLLKAGISVEMIAQTTGLTIEEVRNYKVNNIIFLPDDLDKRKQVALENKLLPIAALI